MATYLIAYDINEQLRDYAALKEAIRALGDWQHPMGSVWFVKSDMSASEIATELNQYINKHHDHLFVTQLHSHKSGDGWMQKALWRWLRNQNH